MMEKQTMDPHRHQNSKGVARKFETMSQVIGFKLVPEDFTILV